MAEPSGKPAPSASKTPSIEQLRRQIAEEREALAMSLDKLTGEVGEATDAARRQAAETNRRARVMAPRVAAGIALLLVARGVLRRRRRRRT